MIIGHMRFANARVWRVWVQKGSSLFDTRHLQPTMRLGRRFGVEPHPTLCPPLAGRKVYDGILASSKRRLTLAGSRRCPRLARFAVWTQ
jgi:hypothetical protein